MYNTGQIPFLQNLFLLIVLFCLPMFASAQANPSMPDAVPSNRSTEPAGEKEEIITLDPKTLAEYEGAIQKVVNELSSYISLIGDKRYQDSLRIDAIDQAVKLFINEQQVVQVPSLNGKTKTREVRKYFTTLYSLPYRNVTISFRQVGHLSPLKKISDDKYNAIYYVLQRFEGCNDDNNCYVDITAKKVQVNLEMIDNVTGPETKSFLAVKLGNIGVEETKAQLGTESLSPSDARTFKEQARLKIEQYEQLLQQLGLAFEEESSLLLINKIMDNAFLGEGESVLTNDLSPGYNISENFTAKEYLSNLPLWYPEGVEISFSNISISDIYFDAERRRYFTKVRLERRLEGKYNHIGELQPVNDTAVFDYYLKLKDEGEHVGKIRIYSMTPAMDNEAAFEKVSISSTENSSIVSRAEILELAHPSPDQWAEAEDLVQRYCSLSARLATNGKNDPGAFGALNKVFANTASNNVYNQ